MKHRLSFPLASMMLIALLAPAALAGTFDVELPPGANFERAAFRLWAPDDRQPIRAALVLVPGSNGDGRDQVEDSGWQELARKHRLALVGVFLTDKEHDDMFIEHYIEVGKGSGDAFFRALSELGEKAGRPELASAPLLLWGMSAGGEFNYELAVWKPERVIGFVVNKGGIYYSALASKATREVPGLFFIGGTDLAFRNDIIRGIYSMNRRAKALWALVEEPGVAHEVARSREMAVLFYEDLLARRLPANGQSGLTPLDRASGFVCDPVSNRCEPEAGAPDRTYPTAWLPSETLTRAWLAVTTSKPF